MRLPFARQIGFDRASLPAGAQNPKTARVTSHARWPPSGLRAPALDRERQSARMEFA